MKTIFMIILFFLANTIFAQITPKHMALVTKKTATWCSSCGTWGWTLQEEIVAQNSGKAVFMQVHSSSSSDLYNSTASTLQNNFPYVGSVPAWYVNGVNNTAYAESGGIYTTTTKNNIKSHVDSTYAVSPVAGCSYNMSIDENVLTINAQTQFFQSTSGIYYLAVYLVEDNVVEYQNGIGFNAVHQDILRGSASSSTFGSFLMTGSIPQDTIINTTFIKTLSSAWNKDNLSLVFVIWEKIGSKYYYVNAFADGKTVGLIGINENNELSENFSVFPNPASDFISITDFPQGESIEISIYNVYGQLVFSQESNNNSEKINIAGFDQGVYFVKITLNGQSKTIKFLKE